MIVALKTGIVAVVGPAAGEHEAREGPLGFFLVIGGQWNAAHAVFDAGVLAKRTLEGVERTENRQGDPPAPQNSRQHHPFNEDSTSGLAGRTGGFAQSSAANWRHSLPCDCATPRCVTKPLWVFTPSRMA